MNVYTEKATRLYRDGKFSDAVNEYSKAIVMVSEHDHESSHTLYSNRCAAYLQMNDVYRALADAQVCVNLKPTWAKGYLRLGGCYIRLNRVLDAIKAYEQASKLEPNNTEILVALNKARNRLNSSNQNSSTNGSYYSNDNTDNDNSRNNIQQFNISATIKQFISKWSAKFIGLWTSMDENTRTMIFVGIIGILFYFLFLSQSSFGGNNYHYSSYDYFGSGGGGMSWFTWGAIMLAAYKVPPMFPNELGQYARPFFGMSWTTFMWLLSMLNQNSRGGRSFYSPRGGSGFGRRRF